MNAWQGDWQARLYRRVQEQGFPSVAAFAASLPRATLLELSDVLGQDIAAVQIERALHAEAEDSGRLEDFAKDMLVRELRQWLRAGWRIGSNFESEAAGAWADWKSCLDERFSAAAGRIWHWLKAADIPRGWLPEGPDDPIIERAFTDVQFEGADSK